MRTTIKAKVHLLQSEKGSKIFLCNNDYLQFDEQSGTNYVRSCIDFKHLYFTTDEEIKEGDWFIFGDILRQAKTIDSVLFDTKGYEYKPTSCKKIAATTNPELWVMGRGMFGGPQDTRKDTPKIDIPFIEAYIKAYNEGKPITEVLLEKAVSYTENEFHKIEVEYKHQLKLKPNGSVIVHPVKEKMYTREEFKKAIWNFGCELWIEEYGENPNEEKTNMTEIFNNWFNKNYPE